MQTAKQYREDKIKAAQDRFEEEKRKLALEEKILSILPDDFQFHFLHVSSLYGSVASISVGDSFPHYGKPDTRQTLAQVQKLIEQFPPLPTVLVRDGCVGVQPEEWEKTHHKERSELTYIWGVSYRLDCSEYGKAHFEWYTQLGDIIIRINAHMLSSELPATASVRYARYPDGEIKSVLSVSLNMRKGVLTGYHIKYGGGTHKDPGTYLLYWDRFDTGTDSDYFKTIFLNSQ